MRLKLLRNPKCARGWGIKDVRNEPSAMGAHYWVNLGPIAVAVFKIWRFLNREETGKRWYQSRRGWFYIGFGGDLFLFHLSLGRLTITYDAK